MESIEHELNDYLFHEFGMDEEDEGVVSETWPFILRRLGEIGDSIIFEFDDGDDQYFAIGGPCLDVLPKRGMTFDDLTLQFAGSKWIAAQRPVTLEESRPGDDSVPSGLERRRALEELGRDATGDPGAEVMEGLFLRSGGQYLGLYRIPNESEAVVVGLNSPFRVGLSGCSAPRRLSWGVGQWLRLRTVPNKQTDAE